MQLLACYIDIVDSKMRESRNLLHFRYDVGSNYAECWSMKNEDMIDGLAEYH